ncbi:MAG: AAA family ATPase [Candidatus Parabeggiatoa sp.]|nr:AAA family ATPase [Candidatus Parabeggiatoa sp.]
MFRRIHIQNFLSCQDVVIDNMEGMTALIGRNGSGKTNVLKAIAWIANSVISHQPIKTSRDENTEIKLFLELDNAHYHYELKIIPKLPQAFLIEKLEIQISSNHWQTLFHRQRDIIQVEGYETEIKVGIAIPSLSALMALLPQESTLMKQISSLINFLQAVRYYPLDEKQLLTEATLFEQTSYINWLNQYQTDPDTNSSVVMRLLHLSLERATDFKALKTLLGSKGLDIIEEIKIETIHSSEKGEQSDVFYRILFQPSLSEHSNTGLFSYHHLSFGTRRVLRILVSVIYDKSTVLLLEQPEDGIHVGLLHKLIPLFKSYADQGQFIFASHSPEIVNRLAPQEIRLVTMENGFTFLRPLNETEKAVAHQFICEEGTLSDFIETLQEE